jgi:tRNA (cytidine32/uridine32-2'-O)-methyltransferase
VLVRPVLVRPRHDGNVGGVVRVAANFAVPEVVVVAPSCDLEGNDFRRMTMGAEARVALRKVATLEEAVADADVVVGTTSGRDRDSRYLATPEEISARLAEGGASSVAVVFGSERGGLTQQELRRSHMLMTIPADPDFPTLNLVQAVAITLAALRRNEFTPPRRDDPLDEPASTAEFDTAVAHLERALIESSFLEKTNPGRVTRQVRNLLGRAVPSRREVAIVRGLASHIDWLWRRTPPDGRSSG